MKNKIKIAAALLLIVTLFSCKTKEKCIQKDTKMTEKESTQKGKASANTIYKVLLSESHGGYKDAKQFIINDNQSLSQVYMKLNMMRKPGISVPKIDFDKNTVLALFLGTKTAGGYTYEITAISTENDALLVNLKEEKPTITTAVITQPSLFVLIPKTTAKSIKLILE